MTIPETLSPLLPTPQSGLVPQIDLSVPQLVFTITEKALVGPPLWLFKFTDKSFPALLKMQVIVSNSRWWTRRCTGTGRWRAGPGWPPPRSAPPARSRTAPPRPARPRPCTTCQPRSVTIILSRPILNAVKASKQRKLNYITRSANGWNEMRG